MHEGYIATTLIGPNQFALQSSTEAEMKIGIPAEPFSKEWGTPIMTAE